MMKNLSVEESERFACGECEGYFACGFVLIELLSSLNLVMCSAFYKNVLKVASCVTFNQVKGIFGFDGENHIGKIVFPVQAAPSFSTSFPHLFSGKNTTPLLDTMCNRPRSVFQNDKRCCSKSKA
ncbi:hypothetical protein AQUCO_03900147v1 [Aquilegia coerulea]|uniref:Tryptophanyl-tRNA synthetase n=1 Tax=Aquilegia coerulea TaxID=218851 RepID=A0A2G5CRW5_AQUCA|nr:hypothetical protein AQUCO_03900147v1 [Aquilegia coerulea]